MLDKDKIDRIKELREITGLGLLECRTILESCNYDVKEALQRYTEGGDGKERMPHTKLTAGTIASYIHLDRIGAMVQLNCETDFNARSLEFKELANNIVRHVVGMNPSSISELLDQPYVRDPKNKTVRSLIAEYSASSKEVIEIGNFARFEIGSKFKTV